MCALIIEQAQSGQEQRASAWAGYMIGLKISLAMRLGTSRWRKCLRGPS